MSGRQIYARTIASGGALLFTHGSNRLFPLIENESTQYKNLALSRPDNENLESNNQTVSVVMSSSELVALVRMWSALHIPLWAMNKKYPVVSP